MEEMDIWISSPGGPGTSLIDTIKQNILTLASVLNKHEDFDSLKEFKTYMTSFGMSENYLRNIFPYIQNLGFVDYTNLNPFKNDNFFTNLGYAFLDVLRSVEIANKEKDSDTKELVLQDLRSIEQVIVFQGMKKMMMSEKCGYAIDFFDVLRFVKKYKSIDLTEYFFLIYARNLKEDDYLDKMGEKIYKYRSNQLKFNVHTKIKKNIKSTMNRAGEAKRINTFPYVKGNFVEAGILVPIDNGRFKLNERRRSEIDSALEEIAEWRILANRQ